MWRTLFALVLVAVVPGLTGALELKDVRACYGLFGATRADNKFLPGDSLFMMFDIDGLGVDEKSGKVRYDTMMEVYAKNSAKPVFTQPASPMEVLPSLGGTRVPATLNVSMGQNQKPGEYFVKLTVIDRVTKKTKDYTYPFELIKPTFGLVWVNAPAVAMPIQPYAASFAVVNMSLDGKKTPRTEITLRVLDEATKKEVAKPVVSVLRDVPEGFNLEKDNLLPMQFPLSLNRPGRFIIEIEALDKLGGKKAHLRYPLNVLDPNTVIGR